MVENLFFLDAEAIVDGQPFPAFFMEQVQREAGTDPVTHEPILETVMQIKEAFQGLFCPPIVGEYQGKKVWHMVESNAERIAAWRALPEYIAGSYIEMALYMNDLAKHVIETVIETEEGQQRVKAVGAEGTGLQLFAPHMFAGVDVAIEPEQPSSTFPGQIREISQTDAIMIQLKEEAKAFGMVYMKTYPQCTFEELLSAAEAGLGETKAATAKVLLLEAYIPGAYAKELIPEPTFEAFRDFVVATPEDQLLSL